MNGHTTDMTRGRPLKLLLGYSVPLLIGTLFQHLYSMADTVIAGQWLGPEAVAAIGATMTLYWLVVGFCLGLNSGCCIMISQLFGAKDLLRLRRGVSSMVLLNLAVTAIATCTALCLMRPLLTLMNTPADIFEDARVYITIVFGGMIATCVYNMAAAFLQAVGNSRTPLYFLIGSSLANIALDVLFIRGFGAGVEGAAWATVAAQALSGAGCVIYILKKYPSLMPCRGCARPDGRLTLTMFTTGLSVALMETVYAVGSVLLQGAVNHLGTLVITAHTAALKAIDMITSPLGALSRAAATFSGQNYGARQGDRIRRGMKTVMLLNLAWSAAGLIITLLCGRQIIIWLTGTADTAVADNGTLYLRISSALMLPLSAVLSIRYVLQATGHRVIPVAASLIEMAMKIVSALVLVGRFGYPGAAATEPATWLVCGVFLAAVWLVRGRRFRFEE